MTDEAARKRRHRNERIVAAIVVIILTGLAAAFVRWNQQQEKELARSNTYVPKRDSMSAETLLLRDYVRIDTSNPPGTNQIAGARWLAQQLQAHGVAAELIESGLGRANVYARIKGRSAGDGLLLLHHIDVVPVDAKEWRYPPFGGTIRLNMLHGRGSLDMKGIAICHLRAFLDVAEAAAKGRMPARDLVFLGVVDEETGSDFGVPWLLEHRPDVFANVHYVLNEGGITEMQAEQMLYFGIEIGTKNHTAVEIEAPRREQLEQLRIAFEPYFISREPDRVLPEVRRFFRELAPTRTQFGPLLQDIDKTIASGSFWRLPKGYRELTQNNVGISVPWPAGNAYHVTAHLINLPGEDPDARLRWLEQRIAPFGARVATVLHKDPAIPLSSADTPLFALLAATARREYRCSTGTEILHGQSNDSRFLRARGFACYGVWPFPVDVFESDSIHHANEHVRLDWFDSGVRFMRSVVWDWAYSVPLQPPQ